MTRAFSRRSALGYTEEELERWIQDMEIELAIRQLADIDSNQTANIRIGNPIPQVTGVSTDTSVVSGFGIKWNTVNHPDLIRYEVKVSTNSAFTPGDDTFNFNAVQTNKFITDLDLTQAQFFVKVRAIGRGEEEGAWSATINTLTGVATPNHIVPGACKIFVEEEITSFSPSLLDSQGFGVGLGPEEGTFGSAVIETVGGIVFPYAICTGKVSAFIIADGDLSIEFELLRDGMVIDSGMVSPKSNVGDMQLTVPAFASFDTPFPGFHTYSIHYTLDGAGGGGNRWCRYEPVRQVISLVEFRR